MDSAGSSPRSNFSGNAFSCSESWDSDDSGSSSRAVHVPFSCVTVRDTTRRFESASEVLQEYFKELGGQSEASCFGESLHIENRNMCIIQGQGSYRLGAVDLAFVEAHSGKELEAVYNELANELAKVPEPGKFSESFNAFADLIKRVKREAERKVAQDIDRNSISSEETASPRMSDAQRVKELTRARKQIRFLEEKIALLENEKHRASVNIDELQEVIAELEQERSDVRAALLDKIGQEINQNSTLAMMKHITMIADRTNKDLEEKLFEAEGKVSIAEANQRKMNREIGRLKRTLEEKEGQFAALEREKNAMATNQKETEVNLEVERERNEVLRVQIRELSKLPKHIESLEDQLRVKTAEAELNEAERRESHHELHKAKVAETMERSEKDRIVKLSQETCKRMEQEIEQREKVYEQQCRRIVEQDNKIEEQNRALKKGVETVIHLSKVIDEKDARIAELERLLAEVEAGRKV